MVNTGNKLKSGFSLVEVMISMTIFSVLAISITGVTLSAYKGSEAAIHESVCNSVAGGYLEQLISAEFSDLVTSLNDNSVPLPTQINQGTADPITVGEWTKKTVRDDRVAGRKIEMWVQPELENVSGAGIRMLALRIRYKWSDPITGREHERRICTVRSDVQIRPSSLY